ncbi:hypothetical protein QFC22_005123 [Naganishia vaughanmartiniae]|uniref:Uncharacterized protein n=1 Tax=Naganishia vaughanmartiniae TaxID=1424756 RepID=A0ACC2WXU8_9TREE|nr:hypothetical protein QFC22_005123 [Naganishia vaughanmartiniae]
MPSEIRGSYRSVAVSRSALEEVVPCAAAAPVAAGGGGRSVVERQLTYSRPRRYRHHHGLTGALPNDDANQREEQGQREPSTAPDGGDIYLFSNSNFTDVQRELHSIAVVVTDSSNPGTSSPRRRQVSAKSTNLTSYLPPSPSGHAHAHSSAVPGQQPPGLRFPFAAHVGHHLVLGGTYLSQSAAQFAVWALNFRTWQWEKISAHVLEGSGGKVVRRRGESGEMVMAGGGGGLEETGLPGGSWNRAVYWPAGAAEAEVIDVTHEHAAAAEHGKEKQRRKQGGKLLVFGNRYRNLQDDCESSALFLLLPSEPTLWM